MAFLKSLGKLAKRAVRSKIVQGALNTATGGVSGKVLSVAKSIGAKVHANKVMKRQQKAVAHAVSKLDKMPRPDFLVTSGGSRLNEYARDGARPSSRSPVAKKRKPKAAKATKMGPMTLAAYRRLAEEDYKSGATGDLSAYQKALIAKFGNGGSKTKTKKSTGAKRKAPTGGLDLKAIAAKWKKAGKPGKWIDFVKANR